MPAAYLWTEVLTWKPKLCPLPTGPSVLTQVFWTKSERLSREELGLCRWHQSKLSLEQRKREAEDIKKSWQEYTEKLYKKDLHDPDNHDGVITHLEPNILECEVKWALESITVNKASGGDGIPVELF